MFTQQETRELEDVWNQMDTLSTALYELKKKVKQLRDHAVRDSDRVEQQAHRIQS